ncbi:HAAS signaling domain-containing protein [Streptomyces sp. NPDC090442]|uniref:HAAS signaling domain-containing protein n=1 Tax=Streptomyces sp. NPDC090442 TaxID=3365962 RepID=UPI0037FC5880
MKTLSHPEIRRYLASVRRATSALPAGRRKELIDDLTEHIQVASAERPGELAAILAELGDPDEIASTALRRYGTATGRRGARNPQLIVTLLALGSILGALRQVPHLGQLALVAMVAGVVALCLSPWWTAQQKWIAVAWLVLPNWVLAALHGTVAGFGHGAEIANTLVAVAIRAAALVWLWRRRVAPEPGRSRLRLPRWALVLCWSATGLVVALEVVVWLGTFTLSGHLHEVKGSTFSP